MIKISVIIPIYNVEKYLKRCLDSIINQTLKDIEIICINDGSTDNSTKILDNYAKKDTRIKIINKTNNGISAARNNGLDIAAGKYVSFIDSDDWIDLDFLEKLYNAAEETDSDIAVGGIIRINWYSKKTHLKITKRIVTENADKKFEVCDVPDKCYVWNKIYKLESLKRINLKFEEGRIYEDVVFSPIILNETKRLVSVPDINYYYWRHNSSTVKRKDQTANNDSEYMHKKGLEYIEKNNIKVTCEKTKRYKFLGSTILKIRIKGNTKRYSLFNIIKWQKKTA